MLGFTIIKLLAEQITVQLQGTLTQFSLRELIEMVLYSSVTGLLEIQVDNELTLLFFVDGQPIGAHAHDLIGTDAVALMFGSKGNFQFYAGSMPEWKNLWIDPWELITRGEAMAPRWAAVRQEIPSTKMIPIFVEPSGKEAISIPDHFWPLLTAVDSKRNIVQISNVTNTELLDTCEALVVLKRQGLIKLLEPQQQVVSKTVGAPAPTKAAEEGFFERLIAQSLTQNLSASEAQISSSFSHSEEDGSTYPSPGERYIASESRYRELMQRYADIEN